MTGIPEPDGPVFTLAEFPVHLGLGATVERHGRFTGTPEWYEGYEAEHSADGVEGRLVSLHTFTEPWAMWEMHPLGEELVVCTAGAITLHQEIGEGDARTVTVHAGTRTAVRPR